MHELAGGIDVFVGLVYMSVLYAGLGLMLLWPFTLPSIAVLLFCLWPRRGDARLTLRTRHLIPSIGLLLIWSIASFSLRSSFGEWHGLSATGLALRAFALVVGLLSLVGFRASPLRGTLRLLIPQWWLLYIGASVAASASSPGNALGAP